MAYKKKLPPNKDDKKSTNKSLDNLMNRVEIFKFIMEII
jgi:hypothetical protein